MNASYPDGINDAFSEFDAKALASASVAQAHAAKLTSGEEVIVKIIRPNIWDQIKEDMNILFLMANLLDKFSITRVELIKVLRTIKKQFCMSLTR